MKKNYSHVSCLPKTILLILFIILPIRLLALEFVVDNAGANFSMVGPWSLSSSATDKYGLDYQFALTDTTLVTATSYAMWNPTITESSSYQVYYWYPQSSNRPIDAQFIVNHNGGLSTFYANQTVHGGQWNLLGTFAFSSGTNGYVKVTNYSKTAGKAVIADAIKFTTYSPPTTRVGGEFRGVWADSWNAGFLNTTSMKAMIDTTRNYNFNAALVEVRKIADAYYNSSFEPFANNISPSKFDMLSAMINYAHDTSGGKPYVEVHAWMVTYRDWVQGSGVSDTTNHVFFKHPEWFTKTYLGATASGSSMFLDPGVPEVEDYLVNVYMDIIKHYRVDGIHYDYVRMDGPTWGYNSISSTRFYQEYSYSPPTVSSQAGWNTWCQWRRDAITAMVKKVYACANEINPDIKITGALITWYPYNNDFTQTRAYYDVFQDWHTWMKMHILDASVPMNYFNDSSYPVSFRGWASFAVNSSYGRHAYIGPGIYLNSTTQTADQITYVRDTAHAQGVVDYSYGETNNGGVTNSAFYTMMSSKFYTAPTHTPSMSWKSTPTVGILKGQVYDNATSPAPYFNGINVYKSRVIAKNESTLAAYTTTTDATGFYAFPDLSPGSYTITGFYPPSYALNDIQTGKSVSAGLVSTVNINFDQPVHVPNWNQYASPSTPKLEITRQK